MLTALTGLFAGRQRLGDRSTQDRDQDSQGERTPKCRMPQGQKERVHGEREESDSDRSEYGGSRVPGSTANLRIPERQQKHGHEVEDEEEVDASGNSKHLPLVMISGVDLVGRQEREIQREERDRAFLSFHELIQAMRKWRQ